MPLMATKILSDYISQMRNLHSEVISQWQEIKARCPIHGSLLKKVQSFDVLLNLVNIQHGLLSDEVPNVKREFKRQLSVRDTKIKELVAKLDHLSPSARNSRAGGRPPYVESRRYPKSTTPTHRNKRNSNRAPVPRVVSADNIRGGPISDSPFYSSRTPCISASPSVASKHPASASMSIPPVSPHKQWSPMHSIDPVEEDFIDSICSQMKTDKTDASPRSRQNNATDLRSNLKRSQRSLTKSNSRTMERERMDLQETSLNPGSPKHIASRRNRMRQPSSPQHYNSRSPRKPKTAPNVDPMMESERQPRLILPKKTASPRVKPRAQVPLPQAPPRRVVTPEAPPRQMPQSPPSSRAKKDPTTDPQTSQDDIIRKEFELLGIEYTPENVQIPAVNPNVSPLENDAVNFDAMQAIVIPNEKDSNLESSPARRRSRRPSLCRPDNVGDWADTEEGREHAKQLEQEMIRELARLSTEALQLSPTEMKKQEELLIQGLTENGIESDSESEISDLNSESDISYSTIGSPRASAGPAMAAMASPHSAIQGSPPVANLALS